MTHFTEVEFQIRFSAYGVDRIKKNIIKYNKFKMN